MNKRANIFFFVTSLFAFVVLCSNSITAQTLLYQGIYTDTGYGSDEDGNPINSGISRSCYIKIFSNRLIVTTTAYSLTPIDITYVLINIDDGLRTYSDMKTPGNSYIVDEQYDVIRVYSYSSSLYGNNVTKHWLYTYVKGEHYKEYNQKHDADGSSPKAQYQKEIMKGYLDPYGDFDTYNSGIYNPYNPYNPYGY